MFSGQNVVPEQKNEAKEDAETVFCTATQLEAPANSCDIIVVTLFKIDILLFSYF